MSDYFSSNVPIKEPKIAVVEKARKKATNTLTGWFIRNSNGIFTILLLLTAFYFANFYPLKIQFVWHYLAPLIGPLGWIYFYKSLQNLSIWNYFVFWGKNSLCLMVTHYSITLVVLKYILMEFSHIPLEGWISFVAFFISLPIQHVMLILIDKYAPKTLGK